MKIQELLSLPIYLMRLNYIVIDAIGNMDKVEQP